MVESIRIKFEEFVQPHVKCSHRDNLLHAVRWFGNSRAYTYDLRKGNPSGVSANIIMAVARLYFKPSPSTNSHENGGIGPKLLRYVENTRSSMGVSVAGVALNGSLYLLKGPSAARTCNLARLRVLSSMLVTRELCELPDYSSFNVN